MNVKWLIIGSVTALVAVFCIINPSARLWCANASLGVFRYEIKKRPETLAVKDKKTQSLIFASENGVYVGTECVGTFASLGSFMPGKIQPDGILLVDPTYEAKVTRCLATMTGVGLICVAIAGVKSVSARIMRKRRERRGPKE